MGGARVVSGRQESWACIDEVVNFRIDRPTRQKEGGIGALQLQSLTGGVELPTDGNSILTGLADIPGNRNTCGRRFLNQAIEPRLGNTRESLSCTCAHF